MSVAQSRPEQTFYISAASRPCLEIESKFAMIVVDVTHVGRVEDIHGVVVSPCCFVHFSWIESAFASRSLHCHVGHTEWPESVNIIRLIFV